MSLFVHVIDKAIFFHQRLEQQSVALLAATDCGMSGVGAGIKTIVFRAKVQRVIVKTLGSWQGAGFEWVAGMEFFLRWGRYTGTIVKLSVLPRLWPDFAAM